MDLDSLQSLDPQILLGAAVAVVAIVVGGAFFLFSSKKSKGLKALCLTFFSPSWFVISWLYES